MGEGFNVIAFSPGQRAGTRMFSATPIGAGAAPEPATWAMMIGGFGLIGGGAAQGGATSPCR